jgi:hypothetical protein
MNNRCINIIRRLIIRSKPYLKCLYQEFDIKIIMFDFKEDLMLILICDDDGSL